MIVPQTNLYTGLAKCVKHSQDQDPPLSTLTPDWAKRKKRQRGKIRVKKTANEYISLLKSIVFDQV